MSFCLKKKAVLVVLIALSATAFAKPAHLLLHVAKSIVYPVRHPRRVRTARGNWSGRCFDEEIVYDRACARGSTNAGLLSAGKSGAGCRSGTLGIHRRSSNQVPGELHGEAITGNLPGHQLGSLRRERSDYGRGDLLWMGGDTGSS